MTNRAPEPAAGRPGQAERPERRAKGPRPSAILVFMYAAGTVIVVGLLLAFPGPTAKRVPYSDFKQMVRAGQVAAVVIDEHRIRGTAKGSNQAFEATRIEDPHLLEELERQGVKFTGETETTWWSNWALTHCGASVDMRKELRRRFSTLGEPPVEWAIRLCGWSAIVFVFAIFFFVFREGAPVLFGELDLKEFFTSINWRPDSTIRPQFGILALLAGTASVTALAMARLRAVD